MFLSRGWLSLLHIDCMFAVIARLRQDVLPGTVPCTALASSNFVAHVIWLGTTIASAAEGIRIAAVALSPPDHLSSLLIDSQARTISWGEPLGRVLLGGFEDRLRTWSTLFVPQTDFLPLRDLPCSCQTDSYSCELLDTMNFSRSCRANVSISVLCPNAALLYK